MFSEAATTNI